MQAFNKAILAGNLTRDPELRYTPKGTAVCQITLALNRKWKDESGQEREECSFIDCVLWGRRAEVVAQYLKKGFPLLVEGALQQQTWDDKNTHQKRSKVIVNVQSFTFLPNGQAGEPRAAQPSTDQPAPTNSPAPGYDSAPEEDDVPF